MNFLDQFNRVTVFLQHLECLGIAGQRDAFMNEVIETGGTYITPDNGSCASHLFEISLYNVVAYGGSEAEAIRNWKKTASAQLNGGGETHPQFSTRLPFPTPRSHAEEIENARAIEQGVC